MKCSKSITRPYDLYRNTDMRKKVDYFLVSKELEVEILTTIKYTDDEEEYLDHDPITLTINLRELHEDFDALLRLEQSK